MGRGHHTNTNSMDRHPSRRPGSADDCRSPPHAVRTSGAGAAAVLYPSSRTPIDLAPPLQTCVTDPRLQPQEYSICPQTGAVSMPFAGGLVGLVDLEDFLRLPIRPVRGGRVRIVLHKGGPENGPSLMFVDPTGGKKRPIKLHRWVMGAQRGDIVDHANRNSLDCRKSNLRFATPSQSSINRVVAVSASGYRGVKTDFGKYRPRISSKGVVIVGQAYDCPAEAARHYDRLAREHHGEFAILNFPDEVD